MSLVEDVRRLAVRRNPRGKDLNPVRKNFRPLFLKWDRARYQEPGVLRILRRARLAIRANHRREPSRIVEISLFPAPRIWCGVELFPGADRYVARPLVVRDRMRRVSFVGDASPIGPGVHDLLGIRVALEQESSLMTDLRDGSVPALVPHHGRKGVFAGLELRSDVDGFVAPMKQVAARGAYRDLLAIDEELIAVIAGNVNYECAGRLPQIEGAAEMVDAVIVRRGAGHR